ncbi:MAG: sigma-E processing peptidase SpoIIGA [Peptococcia bacterium]|jgi:stage II sporulation protein GA (sporulation sigma-E factor processing peptidase)
MNESELVVEVYLDILLLVNFVMDFIILWVTGKMANLTRRKLKITLGALCGALYSLVIFFPAWPVLGSFLAKFACSLLMVWLAFRPLPLGKYLRVLAYFYGLSFAMGGAVLGAIFLLDTQSGSLQSWNGVSLLAGLDFGWLLVGLVVALLLAYGGFNCLKKNWLQQKLVSKLLISLNNQQVTLSALLDTGNQLIDPVSQKPVIVAEAGALKTLLPETLWLQICREPYDKHDLYFSFTRLEEEWQSRLSLIPFNSVGKMDGVLVGLRPDFVTINNGAYSITTTDVVIGLVNRALSREGQYTALLQPQIWQDNQMKKGEVRNGGEKNKHPRTMEY